MTEFIIMNLCFIIMMAFVVHFKEVKSNLFLLWFGTIISMYTPSLYVFFGGQAYRVYGNDSALEFYLISAVSFLFVACVILFVRLLTSKIDKNFVAQLKVNKPTTFAFSVLVIVVYLYIIYYWNHWPFMSVFRGVSVDRPDVVKGIYKGYFTFSVFAQILMPAIFFHYHKTLSSSRLKYCIAFILCSFPLIVGGNKGIFLYFLFFVFLYSPYRIQIKHILLGFVACLLLYAGMKSSISVDAISISYLIESISTRFFVTQGMSSPALFELLSQGLDVSVLSSNGLKYKLFEYVYGYSPGSMPIFFTSEIYARYGVFSLMIIGIILSGVIAMSSVYVRGTGSLFVGWVYYYCLYSFVMAGVSDANIIRYVFSFFIVCLFMMSTYSKCLQNK